MKSFAACHLFLATVMLSGFLWLLRGIVAALQSPTFQMVTR